MTRSGRLRRPASAAARVEPRVPYEPYDASDWPLLELPGGRAEVGYQFTTRNLELFDFVRVLAARFFAEERMRQEALAHWVE